MVKSLSKERFSGAVEAANEDDVGVTFNPQRLVDEIGALQVELNQDPVAGAVGKIALEGRLSPDASFVEIASVDMSVFIGGSGAGLSRVVNDVDILPQMRIALRDNTGFSSAVGTTAKAWVME